MKKSKLTVFLFSFISISGAFKAQTSNPPPVLHREITWASQTPEGPAVFDAVPLFVGENQPTSQIESGEDWWYDTKPIYENGIHTGYIVVGFTTYRNMYFSEHELNPPGFLNVITPPLGIGTPNDECSRLLNLGETISQYRQVISRFDLRGKMIWCKPLNYGNALNSVMQAPDGSFYAIGESESAYKYGPIPQPYMYNPGFGATNLLPLVNKVNPASLLSQNGSAVYGRPRILLYHFDANGDELWSYQYGYEDFPDPTTQLMLDDNSAKLSNMQLSGVDLAMSSDGTKLILAGQTRQGGIYTAIVNPQSGNLITYNVVSNSEKHWVKQMDCDGNGNCYIVGGNEAANNNQSFVYKMNENLQSDPSWLVNPKYLDLDINSSNPGESVLMDVVADNTDIVIVGLEKTQGSSFYSGDNAGNGIICKLDVNGNVYQSAGFGQVKAFDLRIGLIKTQNNDYAIVTSVPGSYNYSTPQSQQVIQNYANSIVPSICATNFNVGLMWNTDTYVAKFDPSLNKIWETSFDSDDQNPTFYPGDIKKQECMYRIAEAADGKLFVVGNSSHNTDDYFAALIESDCQQDVSYNYPLLTVPSLSETVIQNNTTTNWATNLKVKGIVRIKAGAVLNITNATIEMANSQTVGMPTKFIIEPGGLLNVTNSTITCIQSCGKQFWDGIEVLGNSTANQIAANQGKIVLVNSTIEYANEAIIPGDYHDFTKNGGIINATGSNFRNNNRSVQYLPYQNKTTTNGPENNNVGFFDNCTFEWTDDFLKDSPQPAITMYGVKGINIRGCTFQDIRVNTTLLTNRARGIFTIDAGYTVRGKGIGIPPNHDYFDATGYDVGEFINLYRGIENLQAGSLKPFVVDHVRFNDCHEGIIVSGTDKPFIFRNEFNYTSNSLLPLGKRRELSILGATGYQIEGNLFKNDNSEFTYGASIDNSGIEENLIRKNKFFDLRYGNYAQRRNRDANVFSVKGLQFLCNTHEDNVLDMRNFSVANTDGIRLEQGAAAKATLNEISQNLNPGQYNFVTNDNATLKYYYYNTNENPVVPFGTNINALPASNNSCPSRFSYIKLESTSTVLSQNVRPTVVSDLEEAIDNKSLLEVAYLSDLANGDDPSLYTLVANLNLENAAGVYSELENLSPYLSLELMTELGDVSSEIFDESWYVQLIKDNIELFEDATFRDFLVNKEKPLTSQQMEDLFAYSQSHSTVRGTVRSNIGIYTAEIEHLQNVLLMDYLVSEDQNDQVEIPGLITDRNHYAHAAELVDYYFGLGDYSQAQQIADDLSNDLSNMPLASVNEELEDFITLKNYLIIKLTNDPDFYANISESEIGELVIMRDNFSGKAYEQVNNLLCFHAGNCQEVIWLDEENRNPLASQVIAESAVFESVSKEFILYPNPNKGQFTVSSENGKEIASIHVCDIQGKVMEEKILATTLNSLELNLENMEKGIYLIQITSSDGKLETIRMMKN